MSTAPSTTQVLSLYREFLRNATKFNNYNFKNYFIRRSRDAFNSGKTLKTQEEITNAYTKAQQELEVLKRQSLISRLYSFEKLVVEPLNGSHKK
ncbi:hypothetical protein WICPIJ_008513 [Wickerhamomyces pijperi]|uniref:Complex 1 LYR protein domain-containing protein n=1 Tax=Wickerhamomyces pijperi TaxID=599730 RepID=A0A9P8TI89_WICPI|nr:hypothetical protein WICPIJ_008513 [Wickerhamomyces pijperi]